MGRKSAFPRAGVPVRYLYLGTSTGVPPGLVGWLGRYHCTHAGCFQASTVPGESHCTAHTTPRKRSGRSKQRIAMPAKKKKKTSSPDFSTTSSADSASRYKVCCGGGPSKSGHNWNAAGSLCSFYLPAQAGLWARWSHGKWISSFRYTLFLRHPSLLE